MVLNITSGSSALTTAIESEILHVAAKEEEPGSSALTTTNDSAKEEVLLCEGDYFPKLTVESLNSIDSFLDGQNRNFLRLSRSEYTLASCCFSLFAHALRQLTLSYKSLGICNKNPFQKGACQEHYNAFLILQKNCQSCHFDFAPDLFLDKAKSDLLQHSKFTTIIQSIICPALYRSKVFPTITSTTNKTQLENLIDGILKSDDTKAMIDKSFIVVDVIDDNTLSSFPTTIIVIRDNEDHIPYQTVGAIYETISARGKSSYHLRILSRRRDSTYYAYDLTPDSRSRVEPICLLHDVSREVFPFVLPLHRSKYKLIGAMVFHNAAVRKCPSSVTMSSHDEILNVSGNGNSYLSYVNILLNGKFQDNTNQFHDDMLLIVLRAFALYLNAVYPSEVVQPSIFIPPYMENHIDDIEDFKINWEYKSIEENSNAIFHWIINKPLQVHWNYCGIDCKRRQVIIYDPLEDMDREDAMLQLVSKYLKRENQDPSQWQWYRHTYARIEAEKDVPPFGFPSQTDVSNCGVFVCLAAMFLMCRGIAESSSRKSLQFPKIPKGDKVLMEHRIKFLTIINGEIEEINEQCHFYEKFFGL